jgi:hypothetical protein
VPVATRVYGAANGTIRNYTTGPHMPATVTQLAGHMGNEELLLLCWRKIQTQRERECVCVLNKSGEGVVLGWRACVLLWFDSEPKDVLSASRHPGVMLLAMALATTSAQRPSSTVCVCECHSGHQQSSCRLCARKIGSAGITCAC